MRVSHNSNSSRLTVRAECSLHDLCCNCHGASVGSSKAWGHAEGRDSVDNLLACSGVSGRGKHGPVWLQLEVSRTLA